MILSLFTQPFRQKAFSVLFFLFHFQPLKIFWNVQHKTLRDKHISTIKEIKTWHIAYHFTLRLFQRGKGSNITNAQIWPDVHKIFTQ